VRCKDNRWVSGSVLKRVIASCVLLALAGGCKSFLDQSELIRNSGDRLVVPILNSIDPIDESEPEFLNATEIKPEDLKVIPVEYVIRANDTVSVSVFDLIQGGVESVRTSRVSESGTITLPLLPEPVPAAGYTEVGLQKVIRDKYREAGIIQNAQVTVVVVEARGKTFFAMGGVGRPGQYPIVESDFHILNALMQIGDVPVTQDYVYVVRKLASDKPTTRAVEEKGPTTAPVDPLLPKADPLLPKGDQLQPKSEAPVKSPILAMEISGGGGQTSGGGPEGRTIIIDGRPVQIGTTQPAARVGAPTTRPSALGEEMQPKYEFGSTLPTPGDIRIIRVPLEPLRHGDFRYNIVIRPDDQIWSPLPQNGVYYMGGHVGGPGVFSLTGAKVSLKQAIISAHMVDSVAVPYKTDIIRRIAPDREVWVRVDLYKLFEGRLPDIYVKPNDIITVGTDFWPYFLAIARNGVRISYGIGFVYDRNFSGQNNGNNP